jgi:hypothetical protein
MKGLLDLVAILSGVFGLAGLMFAGAPLTPESAPLYTARAAMVIAFVVIPFFMARAIEKLHVPTRMSDLLPILVGKQRRVREIQLLEANEAETTYFDYFFQPGSAQEWMTTSRNSPTMRNTTDGNESTGQ